MRGKQRAYLRSLANTVPALYQIGKDGISENFIKQMDSALEARELVKVHVLETSPVGPREACGEIAEVLHAEPVQVIGGKFVLYRESKDNKKIEIPKR